MSEHNLRYDILKELFNISVGKAAAMLSEIIDRTILLDVPEIKTIHLEGKNVSLEECFPKIMDGTLMVSSISFGEKLAGKANLIFPAPKMRAFINLCMNQNEEKSIRREFTDIDYDIIKEIGNIVLNCVIGEVGDYLSINLSYSLPEVKVFDRIDFRRDIENNDYMHVLILTITFIIDETEIQGAIVIDLTLNSFIKIIEKVDAIEDELYE